MNCRLVIDLVDTVELEVRICRHCLQIGLGVPTASYDKYGSEKGENCDK